jgi:hypothetical protein
MIAKDLPGAVHVRGIVWAVTPDPEVAPRVKSQRPPSPDPSDPSRVENLSCGIQLNNDTETDINNINVS